MRTFAVCKVNRSLVWLLVGVLVVCAVCGASIPAVAAAKSVRKLPIYSVEDDRRIAITFDASWGAERTKGIVDTLASHSVRATFFLTGIWIDAFPDETRYIAAKGMEIGNHSQHHYNMGKMDRARITEEIRSVNDKVEALTGAVPTVFRAPFGDYGNALIEVLEEMDMRCIQWDVDSLDWKGLSAEEIIRRVEKGVRGGSIILCHNNSDHVLEALPYLLTTLSREYTLVTVDELIAGKSGTIDHTGKLHA